MVIEWAMISGVAVPHIKEFARNAGVKLAAKYSDGLFAEAYRRVVPDAKLVKANEAFVQRFSDELGSAMDLPTLNAAPYASALAAFLSNESVQSVLHAPQKGGLS
jgi:hypothetical protein